MGGFSTVGVMILSLILNHVVLVFQDYWLSFWVTQSDAATNPGLYLGVYSVSTFGGVLFTVIRMIALAYATYKASRALHACLFKGISWAPMGFFDATPIGRIVNRFSSDIDAIDAQVYLVGL